MKKVIVTCIGFVVFAALVFQFTTDNAKAAGEGSVGNKLSSLFSCVWSVFDCGGAKSTSTNNQTVACIGEAVNGEATSTTFKTCAGFFSGLVAMAPPAANPALDLTILLHGLYNSATPENSMAATGNYGLTLELRDSADGTGSNYRYYDIELDKYGTLAQTPLDLGKVTPGNYYLVVSQLNHLPVITNSSYYFDVDTTVTLALSDTLSPDFAPVYQTTMYTEDDGKLSLNSGNANVDPGQELYINVLDAFVWINANGSSPGSQNWDIRADFDANGMINVLDILKWIHCNGRIGYASIEPLYVEITSPLDGATTTDEFITVTGIINDNNATVEVNGTSATVTDGIFTAANIQLPLIGDNTITVTAQDSGGGSSHDEINVTRN